MSVFGELLLEEVLFALLRAPGVLIVRLYKASRGETDDPNEAFVWIASISVWAVTIAVIWVLVG